MNTFTLLKVKQSFVSLTMLFLTGFSFPGYAKSPYQANVVINKGDYLPSQHLTVTSSNWQPH